jgi:hypothetical protein
MKNAEYTEGPKARENFESTMSALFKVPKTKAKPKRKKKKSDKG